MPVTTIPDVSRRYQILEVSDPYTFEEWREAVLELFTAPTYLQSHAILVDRRGAGAASAEFVDASVEFFAERRAALSGSRVAIITDDDAAFGAAWMTELMAERDNPDVLIVPFRSYDTAVRWLTTSGVRR